MDTADQRAAEKIGRALDGQVRALNAERLTLLQATARIADIDAELTVLNAELARIQPRRPTTQHDPLFPAQATTVTPRTA